MTGWAIASIYVAVWVVCALKVAWLLIDQDAAILAIDRVDRAPRCTLSGIVALSWPLLLLGLVVFAKLPLTTVELQARLAERDRRIRELEAEMGWGTARPVRAAWRPARRPIEP